MLFWQPMPHVIVDYTNNITFILSILVLGLLGVGITYANICQGEGDVDGHGLVKYMSAEGVRYPIRIKWSHAWIYDYVRHPMYVMSVFVFLT